MPFSWFGDRVDCSVSPSRRDHGCLHAFIDDNFKVFLCGDRKIFKYFVGNAGFAWSFIIRQGLDNRCPFIICNGSQQVLVDILIYIFHRMVYILPVCGDSVDVVFDRGG